MGEQPQQQQSDQTQQQNNASSSSSAQRQIPIVCPGHTRPLAELQFISMPDDYNPHRTLLISACHDRFPMVRDGITGDWIGTFMGHKGAVWCCRMDGTGNLAATASGDFSVQIWDAVTGKSLYQLPHQHIVKTCDFSWNSKYVTTGGHEGIIRIYHLLYPKQEPIQIKIRSSSTNTVTITKINWITNTIIAAGCGDGCIRIWDVNTIVNNNNYWGNNNTSSENGKVDLEPIHIISTTSAENGIYEIRDMELSFDRTILSVACGYSVYFYDATSYQLLKTYRMSAIHFKEEGGVSLHPQHTKFIVGGSDLWVRVYDYNTGLELECLKGHHGPIRCLRYSPNGNVYATGSEDGTIRLWTA